MISSRAAVPGRSRKTVAGQPLWAAFGWIALVSLAVAAASVAGLELGRRDLARELLARGQPLVATDSRVFVSDGFDGWHADGVAVTVDLDGAPTSLVLDGTRYDPPVPARTGWQPVDPRSGYLAPLRVLYSPYGARAHAMTAADATRTATGGAVTRAGGVALGSGLLALGLLAPAVRRRRHRLGR